MKKIFDVTDYGAVAGSDALQTAAIQAAIDACYLAGGGEVTVPTGRYRTGGLRLRSRVTLHLLENAVLEGSRDPEDYTHFTEDTIEPFEYYDEPAWPKPPIDKRWCNSMIRAHFAHDIKVIGEKGSCIDGMNCFDDGEEGYRGPHTIAMYRCSNIELTGYTICNSPNLAHAGSWIENVYMHDVTVEAGHDGLHFRNSTNILIEDCTFHTGDDCVAGFNNLNMAVLRCELNSSCSAFRLGGTDVLIDRCRIFGPGIHAHRLHMSLERKMAGDMTNEQDRHNTLTGFLYFCCGEFELRKAPGNIVVQNCEFTNVDSLFVLEFNRNMFHTNRSLNDITFRNCRVVGVNQPMQLFSHAAEPLTMRIEDTDISFREGCTVQPFSVGYDFEKLELHNVKVTGYDGEGVIYIEDHETTAQRPEVVLDGCEGLRVVRENKNKQEIKA